MAVLSRRDAGRLTVRTVAVPDSGDLLAQLPQPDADAWVHRGAGLVGWGEAARVTLPAGEDRFTAGEKWHRYLFDAAEVDDQVRVRGTGPVAFGTFTFDASSEGSVLIIPRTVIGRDGRGLAWVTTVTEAGQPVGAAREQAVPGRPGKVRWHDGSLPAPQWEQAVAAAVAAIKAGRLRKVVLARDLYATAANPIDRGSCSGWPPAIPSATPSPATAWSAPLLNCSSSRPGVRSARWSWPAPRRAAVIPPKTRRSAQDCWPQPRTPRNTATRSPRCATRWGRCATRWTSRPGPPC